MVNQTNVREVGSQKSLIEEISAELAQTQSELRENDVLFKQSAAEVERLVKQDEQVRRYVRQLQAQDDAPLVDAFREGYEALLGTRQRLSALRGHLERLQSDQRNLERLEAVQRRLLQVATGGESMPAATAALEEEAAQRSNLVRIIQEGESVRHEITGRLQTSLLSSLSNLILQADICQRLFDVNPDRARVELDELKGVASTTFEEAKDALFEIQPLMLDDLGVIPTLRRYAEMLSGDNSTPITVSATGEARRLPPYMEAILFRATQELVRNARHHAQATQIHLLMSMTQEKILIVVEDNGIGFQVDDVQRQAAQDQKGLVGIRERVELAGGALEVQSTLGQGTRAVLTIPVGVETRARV